MVSPGYPLTSQIVGREEYLEALRATVERQPDAPPVLVLHGDPGVGKTVLLQATIEHARKQGIRVVGGTGYESEARLAFAGIHQMLAPIMTYLDRVEPYHREVLRRVLGIDEGPTPDRLAISAATLAVLAAVAEDGPVMIAVEDAHWVDHPTREVMMFVLFRLHAWDLRAVFARRSLTATERVTPGITMLEVEPLDDESSGELLSLLYPDLPLVLRKRVLRYAAGNALALAELPAAISETLPESELLPDEVPLRTRLEATYAIRIGSLDEKTRADLLAIALDGDRLEQGGDAMRATALSMDGVLQLERLGLVTRESTPSGLKFRHPLVRSAIIRSASPEQVRRAHGDLASAYLGDPERRVWHLAAASVEPDDELAREIDEGAEAIARRGGSGVAVAAMRKASTLTINPELAVHRLQRAAEFATESGQLELAKELLEQAHQQVDDPDQTLRLQMTTAQLFMRRDSDLEAAARVLIHALGLSDDPTPGEEIDGLFQLLVLVNFYLRDERDDQQLDGFADALVNALGSLSQLTYDALSNLSTTEPTLSERLRIAFDGLADEAASADITALCRIAMRLDSVSDYRTQYRRLIEHESGSGAVFHAVCAYEFEARDHYLTGNWDACEEISNTGLELSIRHGFTLWTHNFHVALGLLAASRGDVESASEFGRIVEQWAISRRSKYHIDAANRIRGLAALSEFDYERAFEYLSRIGPMRENGIRASDSPWIIFDIVDAGVHCGRLKESQALVTESLETELGRVSPRLALLVSGARALVAPEDKAADAFRTALALPRVETFPFDHARIRMALGQHQRRSRRPGDARPELRHAAGIFARIGSPAWQHKAEQELRATGVPLNPIGESGAGIPLDGFDRLSAQQLEVAQLAASGLTNKEIGAQLYLSPRTISAHLYRIFPKLGISSRSALRDALNSRGLLGEHD